MSTHTYIIKYNKIFNIMVQPYIDKEENLNVKIINYRFIDDLLYDYLGGRVEAPIVSEALIHILKMLNLEVLELMSDLRDIRNDAKTEDKKLMLKRTLK